MSSSADNGASFAWETDEHSELRTAASCPSDRVLELSPGWDSCAMSVNFNAPLLPFVQAQHGSPSSSPLDTPSPANTDGHYGRSLMTSVGGSGRSVHACVHLSQLMCTILLLHKILLD